MGKQSTVFGSEPTSTRLWPLRVFDMRNALARDSAVAVGILIILAAWIGPFLHTTPFFLDSIYFFGEAEYIAKNGLAPISPAGWDAEGHPLLLQELLALSWRLFGQGFWVAHLIIGVFAFLFVWYAYRVATLLYDRRTGMLAAVLLLFYPLFRAQSTVFLLDLPAAAFAMMSVYWLLRRKLLGYLLCSSAMVFTKETAVLLVPTALVYVWATNRTSLARRRMLLLLAAYSAPVFVLLGWYLYHLGATGWFPPFEAEINQSTGLVSAYLPPVLFTRDGAILKFLDLAWNYFGKWYLIGLLTLLILAYSVSLRPFTALLHGPRSGQAVIRAVQAQPVWRVWGAKANLVALGLPILIHLGFSASGNQMQRYLLLEYALFFVLAARAILGLFRSPGRVAAVTLVALAVFIVGWVQPWFGYSLASPSNLLYADFVATHQAAARFIEREYPDRTILANWPEYVELSMPGMGYVSRPTTFLTWVPTNPPRTTAPRIASLGGRSFTDPASVSLADFDLLYYAEDAVVRDDRRSVVLSIIERLHLRKIAEFRGNAAYVGIYGHP